MTVSLPLLILLLLPIVPILLLDLCLLPLLLLILLLWPIVPIRLFDLVEGHGLVHRIGKSIGDLDLQGAID